MKDILQISPSASSRWLKCTASPKFILENKDKIVDEDNSSVYAEEGTLAHDLAAESLLVGYDYGSFEDKEMAEHVKNYCDYVKSMRKPGDKIYVEAKLQPWYLSSDERYRGKDIAHVTHGYSDCTILGANRLVVIDFKYGAGISVGAFENTQMTIYAMSMLSKFLRENVIVFDDDAEIVLAIFQPRARGEEAVREWKLTCKELRDFSKNIYETAAKILAGKDLEFSPSEKACRFCAAKPFCKAHAGWVLNPLPVDALEKIESNEKIELPSIDSLSLENITAIFEISKDLSKYLDSVGKHLFNVVNAGDKTAGYKIVEGPSRRTWEDPEKAEKFLRQRFKKDEVLPPKLISPSQAEKLFDKAKKKQPNGFEDLIYKPKGKPQLAKQEDVRQDINHINASEEFAEYH
jgi:hypothetical protein